MAELCRDLSALKMINVESEFAQQKNTEAYLLKCSIIYPLLTLDDRVKK